MKARSGARALAGVLRLSPDLEIEIGQAYVDGDRALIEFTFHGTLGHKPVALGMVDRIELDMGLIRRRVCYFDPRVLTCGVLTQPRLRPRLLRGRRLLRDDDHLR